MYCNISYHLTFRSPSEGAWRPRPYQMTCEHSPVTAQVTPVHIIGTDTVHGAREYHYHFLPSCDYDCVSVHDCSCWFVGHKFKVSMVHIEVCVVNLELFSAVEVCAVYWWY